MRIIPVPVRSDNYAYLLIDDASNKAAAVDPYDVAKVASAAQQHGVSIVAGITTHHHQDHAGGNQDLADKYPGIPIYGGSRAVEALTNPVKDGDTVILGDNIEIKCLATPCHTQDSICYYATDKSDASFSAVFTGDTLFQAGCGRFFEGDGEQMHKALTYLQSLPNDTVVYNGHEYTKSNVAFALSVDPENSAVKKLQELQRNNSITTGKTTIGDEGEFNPFMRLDTESILAATGPGSEADRMTKLREMKNAFRG